MEQKDYTKPSLRDLQRWMRWVLTDPRGVTDALSEPAPDNVKYRARYLAPDPSCLGLIEVAPPLSHVERLDIYAEGYFARLVESLGADFSTLKRVVGDDYFPKIVADYLKAYPSKVTNIGEVGSHLSDFLRGHEMGFLPELADLEWTVIESFHADDIPPLSLNRLAEIPPHDWANARFRLDPSVRLLKTEWPVNLLWSTRAEDGFSDIFESFEPKPTHMLVHRRAGAVEITELGSLEHLILRRIQETRSLGEICAELESLEKETPPIMRWFNQWVSGGLFRGVDFEVKS